MRLTKLTVLLAAAALVLGAMPGCDRQAEQPKEPEEKPKGATAPAPPAPPTPPAPPAPPAPPTPPAPPAPTAQIDQTDANAVAKAFVQALAEKSMDKTLALIHPKQRDELKGEFEENGFPPVPKTPKVTVEVTEKGGQKTGTFKGNVRALRRLRLRFDDGKWWVVD